MAENVPYTPFPTIQPTADALPEQSIAADEETFGAGIGRAVQRIGSVMGRAQELEFSQRIQMETRNQETQALDASSEFSRQASAAGLEYKKLNGQQAVDKLPEYQKRLTDLRGEIGKTLKGPIAQRAYKVRTSDYETSALDALGTHAANEGDKAYVASLDGANGAAKDRAVQKVISGQNAAIDYTETVNTTLKKAQFLGLPKEAADAMVQQSANAVTVSVINALVAAGRSEEASALLKGSQEINAPGTDIPLLSGEVVGPLTASVHNGLVKSGADYVQQLSPVQRSLVLAKSIEGTSGTPADYLDKGDKVELWRQSLSDIQTMQTRADAAREAILKEENERKASDLKVRINRGLATVDEVERAFNANVISGAQRAEWIKIIEDGGGANADATVFAALNGSAVLDPKNSDDVKAVDGFFNRNIAPQLKIPFATAGKDAARQGVTDFIMRTGIAPESVKRQIRGGLRSGSPQFRVNAADMVDRLSEAAPYVLNDFAAEDIALGKAIAQAVRDGMPPEEATKMADDMERTPKEVQDLRKQRMTQRVGGNQTMLERASGNALNEMIGGRSWVGFIMGYPQGATVTDAAVAEFRHDFERAYLLTGDETAAAKSAQAVFKRSWGVSMISGTPTLTKNAPEKLYGVLDHGADDSAWMRQQLIHDVQGALAPSAGDIAAPPRGMIEPGGMAPNELGDNWATFEVAEDGVHKTVILPTLPGDRPADDKTGFLGDAIERWRRGSRDRMVGTFEDEASAQEVMRSAKTAPTIPVIDPIRIVASPDLQTGGDGTYGVMIRNDSGALEPMLDKKGHPMRWRPDYSLSPKGAELKAKKAAQVQQARGVQQYQQAHPAAVNLAPDMGL